MKRVWLLILGGLVACSEDPMEEVVDCSISDLSIKVAQVKYTDCGIPNGAIVVSASGGNSPYTFKLSDGTSQSEPAFSDLRADLYTIEVVDNNGCSTSAKTLISSKEGFAARVSVTPSGCENNLGTVSVEPLDGVPPYKYQFGENSDYELSSTWDELASRDYSVWISDGNDCFIGVYMFVPTGISFAESVSPIITEKCATAGCHGGTQAPDFTEFADIKGNSAKIEQLIKDNASTKNEILTAQEISLISCWIGDGAPNN